jgi:hypothetical protein
VESELGVRADCEEDSLLPPFEPWPSQYSAPWPSRTPVPVTVTPVPLTETSGPAHSLYPNVVVPAKVIVVPDLTLVRSRVVPAGTDIPLIVIAVQDATAAAGRVSAHGVGRTRERTGRDLAKRGHRARGRSALSDGWRGSGGGAGGEGESESESCRGEHGEGVCECWRTRVGMLVTTSSVPPFAYMSRLFAIHATI